MKYYTLLSINRKDTYCSPGPVILAPAVLTSRVTGAHLDIMPHREYSLIP